MKNPISMAMFSRRALTRETAGEQLDFLSSFEGGLLCPDTCSQYEPIRTSFDPGNIVDPVSWLAKPHGSFFYKKGKPAVLRGEVWNLMHSIDAKAPSPLFCSRWTARFSGSWVQKIGEERLATFVGQLLHVTGSDFGLLTSESDFKAKNIDATGFSYKGLDLAAGVPGLYCLNFLSRELASWLRLEELPQEFASVVEWQKACVVLKFSDSLVDARNPEVLRRQSDAIVWMGRDKFFDVHHPDRELLAPKWNLSNSTEL
jgi:hypothetical protein